MRACVCVFSSVLENVCFRTGHRVDGMKLPQLTRTGQRVNCITITIVISIVIATGHRVIGIKVPQLTG